MTDLFQPDPDRRIRQALRSYFSGPDPDGYGDRLASIMGRLPGRDTGWEILAGWARPRVLAAAMAAGFLLGMTMWQQWQGRLSRVAGPQSPVSVALLENPGPGAAIPAINAALEDR